MGAVGLPLRYQGEFVDLDEERRLFYVGVTRAKDLVELSYARTGSRRETREPSRFLPEGRRRKTATPAAKPAKTRGCQVCGKRLSTPTERALGTCRACPTDVSMDLVDALRAWRTAVVSPMLSA